MEKIAASAAHRSAKRNEKDNVAEFGGYLEISTGENKFVVINRRTYSKAFGFRSFFVQKYKSEIHLTLLKFQKL